MSLELNPKLIFGRITGWGQSGPLAKEAGHDLNYIALSGALHAMGRQGGPPEIPLNLVGDFGGGSMYLAFGIVCALLEARTSGRGQVVDAAMVDGATSLMSMVYGLFAAGYWKDERGSNRLDSGAPWYDVCRSKPAIQSPPPQVGEHTREVLEEWGFAREEIALLQDAGAI